MSLVRAPEYDWDLLLLLSGKDLVSIMKQHNPFFTTAIFEAIDRPENMIMNLAGNPPACFLVWQKIAFQMRLGDQGA